MSADNQSVKEALNKKGAYGADLDLDHYEEGSKDSVQIDDLQSSKYKDYMEKVGVVADEMNRSGTLMFIDNGMSHCSSSQQEGLEMMSTQDALKKYDWVKDYMWKAMDPAKDKYTAKSYLEEADGYFIRVKSGYHVKDPVQTCMMINTDRTIQNVHNIVIVEDNASLEMITGCSTSPHANDALHIGVSEIYLGENCNLTFSMIHSWGKQTGVRPRTATQVGKNSRYTNNYVILNPVGSLQSFPTATLADIMSRNVIDAYGSGRFPNMDICAKSGTAEVGGGNSPHAWFAGFLRNEDAPYAFVVLVENGGSGADVAGSVAAQVLDALVNGY